MPGIGDTIAGRYQLRDLLGACATRRAYRSFDTEVEVEVALWVMDPGLYASSAARAAFVDAVERTQEIRHPHLLRIFDAGVVEGRAGDPTILYLTQQLGTSAELEGRLSTGGASEGRAILRYAKALSGAFDAIHGHGIHHGWLSPADVVEVAGQVKLCGGGLFATIDSRDALESWGGHRRYLAPELVVTGQSSPSSDWYSLGVILLELATGSPVLSVDGALSKLAASAPKQADALRLVLARNPMERPAAGVSFMAAMQRGWPDLIADSGNFSRPLSAAEDNDDSNFAPTIAMGQNYIDGAVAEALAAHKAKQEELAAAAKPAELMVSEIVEPTATEPSAFMGPDGALAEDTEPRAQSEAETKPKNAGAGTIESSSEVPTPLGGFDDGITRAVTDEPPGGFDDGITRAVTDEAPSGFGESSIANTIDTPPGGFDEGVTVHNASIPDQGFDEDATVHRPIEIPGGFDEGETRHQISKPPSAFDHGNTVDSLTVPTSGFDEEYKVDNASPPPEAFVEELTPPPAPISDDFSEDGLTMDGDLSADTSAEAVATIAEDTLPPDSFDEGATVVEAAPGVRLLALSLKPKPDPGRKERKPYAGPLPKPVLRPLSSLVESSEAPPELGNLAPPRLEPTPPPRSPRRMWLALSLALVAGAATVTLVLILSASDSGPKAHEVEVLEDASPKAAKVPAKPREVLVLGPACADGAVHIPKLNLCVDGYESPGKGRQPQSGISLTDARETCAARKMRLCSAAEWESACAGPDAQRWPYGNRFKGEICNIKSKAVGLAGSRTLCRSTFAIFDMSGNIAEWVEEGEIRGGSALDRSKGQCSQKRANPDEQAAFSDVGFRCCADAIASPPPSD